jgi:hypothetical protein
VKPTAFDPERMDVGVATLSAFEYRQTGNAEYSTVHFIYKSFCIKVEDQYTDENMTDASRALS